MSSNDVDDNAVGEPESSDEDRKRPLSFASDDLGRWHASGCRNVVHSAPGKSPEAGKIFASRKAGADSTWRALPHIRCPWTSLFAVKLQSRWRMRCTHGRALRMRCACRVITTRGLCAPCHTICLCGGDPRRAGRECVRAGGVHAVDASTHRRARVVPRNYAGCTRMHPARYPPRTGEASDPAHAALGAQSANLSRGRGQAQTGADWRPTPPALCMQAPCGVCTVRVACTRGIHEARTRTPARKKKTQPARLVRRRPPSARAACDPEQDR